MGRKISDWQKHIAPFLSKAAKQAARTFKPKSGITPAKKKQIASLQKQRDKMNERIRKLRGKKK